MQPQVSFTTWNARALLCNNMTQRRRKTQCMVEALRATSALALQEVHGSHAELQHAVHLAHIEAAIFSSIPERGTGGVAIIVPGLPQSVAADESRFTHTEMVPGRVQRLLIKTVTEAEAAQGSLPNMVVIYNVHNFRLTAQEVDKVTRSLRAEVYTAAQQPERITILVMGDFNFMDEVSLKAPLEFSRKMQRAITRRGKLWAPSGKVLKLKAIEVLHDHSKTSNPDEMIAELQKQWAPVFQPKPSSTQHVQRYLEKHVKKFDCSDMGIPTLGKMQHLIRSLNNSAPGPDGLPYMAWKKTPIAAQVLLNVTIEIMRGLPVPMDFNESLLIFTPKGSEPEDRQTVTRLAKATRPLSLKNTDCKIVAAMGNFLIKAIVAKIVSMEYSTISALVRSAKETIMNWDLWLRRLRIVVQNELEFQHFGNLHNFAPRHWKEPPFAWHLHEAATGFKVGESGAAHRMAFERVIIAFHTYNIQARLCQGQRSAVSNFFFPDQEELDMDKSMPLEDHVEEFRQGAIRAGIATLACISVCLYFYKELTTIMESPAQVSGVVKFVQLAPGEFFFVSLKAAVAVGLLVAFPYILFEAAVYFTPALTRSERGVVGPTVASSAVLFYSGVAFAYYTLAPAALGFFIDYSEGVIESNFSIDQYFEFILATGFATGLAFQVPVLQVCLGLLNVVKSEQLFSVWRYVIVGAAIAGAILTPSTDPVTQLLLTSALCVLYFTGAGTLQLMGR
ncbi:unnamed protein product [Prorocentrum cordatum]|uniref:Sec-independent protein translocase protein TatC n=1 Tax=Prorocentrum cordatum TaxID=2364126 RepID=A0ABN9QXE6_9DINO|nr:unnamed protein product [Polarella glacialis]